MLKPDGTEAPITFESMRNLERMLELGKRANESSGRTFTNKDIAKIYDSEDTLAYLGITPSKSERLSTWIRESAGDNLAQSLGLAKTTKGLTEKQYQNIVSKQVEYFKDFTKTLADDTVPDKVKIDRTYVMEEITEVADLIRNGMDKKTIKARLDDLDDNYIQTFKGLKSQDKFYQQSLDTVGVLYRLNKERGLGKNAADPYKLADAIRLGITATAGLNLSMLIPAIQPVATWVGRKGSKMGVKGNQDKLLKEFKDPIQYPEAQWEQRPEFSQSAPDGLSYGYADRNAIQESRLGSDADVMFYKDRQPDTMRQPTGTKRPLVIQATEDGGIPSYDRLGLLRKGYDSVEVDGVYNPVNQSRSKVSIKLGKSKGDEIVTYYPYGFGASASRDKD